MAQGEKRYAEASQLIEISQEAAAGEDLSAQIIGQGLSARILADSGRHAEAVELASSAVALAAQTDLLSQHADALLDLAHVLAHPVVIPMLTPQPLRPLICTSARAICREPGNHSGTLLSTHIL